MGNDIRTGYSTCTYCHKTFKWIGYASVRSHIGSSHYRAYTIPNHEKDEMLIDYTQAKDGEVSGYCPLCGYPIKVNIREYEEE